MQSQAKTVAEYLKSLPADRRKVVSAVRAVMRKSLPKGYKEGMMYGMIGYTVPLSAYPKGYLDNPAIPLTYAALAAQKNFYAVYLTNVYQDMDDNNHFRKMYKASGKKLDMGKSCVRFRKLEDLSLDAVAWAVGRTPVKTFIADYERSRKSRSR
jgi:hypothetical protein